jgi:GTPase SAR1 family protein
MENESAFEHLYKIIIIGNSGVGKSNLLQRYMDKDFDDDIM